MQMGHVLVTGGAGMIGSNLVRRLAGDGHRVTVVDNLWRGRIENLHGPGGRPVIDLDRDFVRRDLALPGALDDLLPGVDQVVHLADIVGGIGYVFGNQSSIFRQNLLINTHVVASVGRCRSLRGYVYPGTACSFPAALQTGVEAPPLREEDLFPAAPESAYGWSKLMGQYEAELMAQEFAIPVALPILHNVYGAPCDFSRERSQVIPALIRRTIDYPAEDFVVWGSGRQGRAFLHVDDAVAGIHACLEKGLGKGAIQLGPDHCTSIAEIAERVVKISGKDIKIRFDLTKPEGDRGRCADFTKATRELGWMPRVNLREGLTKLYRWMETELAEQHAARAAPRLSV